MVPAGGQRHRHPHHQHRAGQLLPLRRHTDPAVVPAQPDLGHAEDEQHTRKGDVGVAQLRHLHPEALHAHTL